MAPPNPKVRHYDWYADEFIAGTIRLGPNDGWLYTMIINHIYSHGGPIDDDERWLSQITRMHWRTVRAARQRLLDLGKIVSEEGHIHVRRCSREIEKALKRVSQSIQNGGMGGRPSQEIIELGEPAGFFPEKLTTNHQPTNHQPKETTTPSLPRTKPLASLAGFTDWWSEYPNKVGKQEAERKYRAALGQVSPAELLAGLRRYVATKPPDRPWCNPATWLHQGRWQDEHSRANEHAPTAELRPISHDFGEPGDRLRAAIGEDAFRHWVLPCRCVSADDAAMQLEAPSKFHGKWLEQHYAQELRAAWRTRQVVIVARSQTRGLRLRDASETA